MAFNRISLDNWQCLTTRNTSISQTVPDLDISVRDLINRFEAGNLDLDSMSIDSSYDDDDDDDTVLDHSINDLADYGDLNESYNSNISPSRLQDQSPATKGTLPSDPNEKANVGEEPHEGE